MTTGDIVRERALELARTETDPEQAVSESFESCGGRTRERARHRPGPSSAHNLGVARALIALDLERAIRTRGAERLGGSLLSTRLRIGLGDKILQANSLQYRKAFPKQYGSSMSSRSGLQATPPTPAMPAPPGPIETVIEIIPPRGGWSPASGDCSSTTHCLAVSVRAVTRPKSMPSVRRAITASSNSIPRMSGTRVPAGIADAGGEANDSPGSGPLSDGDLDAWMSMRLPVSTGLWRAGEVDVSDEQPTIQKPTATVTAATCNRRHDSDMSAERCISSRPSSSDDVEIERLDPHAVKPNHPQAGGGTCWAVIELPARTVANVHWHGAVCQRTSRKIRRSRGGRLMACAACDHADREAIEQALRARVPLPQLERSSWLVVASWHGTATAI